MSEIARHAKTEQLLQERPFMSVKELSRMLGVSAATVRRDIDKLDEAGRAQKVYGGIAAVESAHQRRSIALPFSDNRDIVVDVKRAIAREAGKLVREGSLIVVHAGSTCFHFGVHIADWNVRVLTHSMPLAAYLSEFGRCQLTVGGGDLHREPGILYDPAGDNQTFFASQFFIGALGVSTQGILESHPLLVHFVQHFAERVNEVVLLVDSRKFKETPPLVALPLRRVAHLVTDDGLGDNEAKMLESQGVRYTIADTSGGLDEQ
ncbi:DeoR/GlpR family DNA-binding transcription regulator [Chromohalobacter sarecensis]|uniref:DeoR/GlpR family DNA-binding transcription regulator n=1 Tax=Chromohalobacter sarecensis TaxID=245294 RepID=A0ABV9D0L8_9GAMM|nr:DeoR/GlpR family DNA-binding transcription regulator [Chromohalobacter sarecensis]MCK0713568.1 DeoR/GlpR family DNA-binding transcription regulator [Chromohalobacter sarecensis]